MAEKKRIITGGNAVAVVVITIISALVLNLIMARVPVPFDLTENKIFTLSDASKEVVGNLEEPVEVKVFISSDMPPPFHTLAQQVNDLLADYQSASGGKLTYQIIQPSSDDEEAEEAARGFGIEKVGIGTESEDEVALRAVYKGVAFVMGDKVEVIADLRTTGSVEFDNFEYDFTKALMNLTLKESRKLAFASGFGGPGSQPGFAEGIRPTFKQLYGDLVEVSVEDISDGEVADDIDALVILNFSEPVSPKGKFAIDQFLQRGGSVGWYQSASGLDEQLMRQFAQQMGPNARMPDIRRPLNHGLEDLFKVYGIELRKDTVLDRKNALALGLVMTEQGLARVSHPASFLMTDIDRELPFTRDIYAIGMPAPSSIVLLPSVAESKDLEGFEVVRTSDVAVRRPTPPQSLNYQDLSQPAADESPGPFVVAAALQGELPSWLESNPIPEGMSEENVVKEKKPARVLVVGSADFFQPNPQLGFNEQLAGFGGQFLISSLEWLVQDNALTNIRGKSLPRLIGDVPKSEQRRVQLMNIVFVPLFFGVLGWTILQLRRRRKDKIIL